MSAPNTHPANEARQSDAAPRFASVLIVDDEPGMLPFLVEGLTPTFNLVETATNAEDAEALRQRCHFDLIISDIRLPGNCCGLRWITALREQGVDTPVIFTAMYADLKIAIRAIRARVQDFILKPFHIDRLLEAVTDCLDRPFKQHSNAVAHRSSETSPSDDVPMIGSCALMRTTCDMIKRIAVRPSTVLIEGESGTGKELAARALHAHSNRSGPFVPVNCGALTTELLESKLFGHIKGAFTGATHARDGLFSFANKGTLFLDEIGDMPLGMQTHLLRVLETHSIRPIGGNREMPVDVRIIAATHRNLKQRIGAGLFREDLYYRLHIFKVHLPALRERLEDIVELIGHFAHMLSAELDLPIPSLDDNELQRLRAYHWPGNIRELRNVIERSMLLGSMPSQCLDGFDNPTPVDHDLSLHAMEQRHILNLLRQYAGNKSATARTLGISRKTLERKCRVLKAQGLLSAETLSLLEQVT